MVKLASILVWTMLFILTAYFCGTSLASEWRMNQLIGNFVGSLAALLVTAIAIVLCGVAPLIVRISVKLAARGRHSSMKS